MSANDLSDKGLIYKQLIQLSIKKQPNGEFPGGLVVRIPGFHCCGLGSIPGQGTEILQAACGQKKNPETKNSPI